jgi:hypothetical protein
VRTEADEGGVVPHKAVGTTSPHSMLFNMTVVQLRLLLSKASSLRAYFDQDSIESKSLQDVQHLRRYVTLPAGLTSTQIV